MKILMTGFTSFLDNEVNPSEEILALLPRSIKGHKIITALLPVVFDECFSDVQKIIDQDHPDIIIHLGLAAGRKAITPERLAVNISDTSAADNKGNKPRDEEIIPGGDFALPSTLDIRKIESILRRKHLPVEISNSAGLYVCNNLMYHTLHYIKEHNLPIKAGFIHLPLMSDQMKEDDRRFNMPLYDILQGIIDSIKTML